MSQTMIETERPQCIEPPELDNSTDCSNLGGYVLVRVLDCFTQAPLAGVEVKIGYEIEEHDAVHGEPDFFRPQGIGEPMVDCKQIGLTSTDSKGWAKFTSVNTWRRTQEPVVHIVVPGYVESDHGTQDWAAEEVERPKENEWTGITFYLCPVRCGSSLPDYMTRVLARINDLSVVRILIEEGANLGNMACAVYLISGLRRLEYQGVIQVCCRGPESRVKYKLLVSGKELGNVDLSKEAAFKSNAGKRSIGFFAGGEYRPKDADYYMGRFQTEYMIFLQPFTWNSRTRSVFIRNATSPPLCTRIQRCLPWQVTYIVEGPEASTALVEPTLFVYGVHQAHDCGSLPVMRNLVRVLKALGTPVTILLVYNSDDFFRWLHFGQEKTPDQEPIPDIKLTHNVKDFLAGEAVTCIEYQEEGGERTTEHSVVRLMWAKTLPQDEFEKWFYQASVVVTEGANTSNLAHMAGKRFVSVSTKLTEYPRGRSLNGAAELQKVTDALRTLNLVDPSKEFELLKYFFSARDGLDEYFSEIKEHVRKETNDQIAMALYLLHLELEARESTDTTSVEAVEPHVIEEGSIVDVPWTSVDEATE